MGNHVMTSSFKMLINGELVDGASGFDVVNPATGKPFAQAPECSKDQLEIAMQAAQAAFPAWAKDEKARIQAMQACGKAIRERAEEIAEILTTEQGKPLHHAQGEVAMSSMLFDLMAAETLEPEVLFEDDTKLVKLVHKPLGVAVGITPWNFPVMMGVSKIVHALRTGNTLVLKPSPYTPLSTLKLGEVLQNVLPPGVLNIVSGGNKLGQWMTEHPIPRKITLTGSVATGKKVAVAAAADLKRVTLELGGNDPAIVLGDVDADKVAQQLFWGAFVNSGQTCIAIKRIYAHESVYPQIVSNLAEMAKQVKMGNGMAAGTELGPINNRMQFQRVQELIDDARGHGARFEAGGDVFGDGGFFIHPAIITGVDRGARIVDEEQFGPALPIMPFSKLDDALERANATHYGLGASVWTSNPERGADIVQQIDSGMGWVNKHADFVPNAPFGGAKWSGIGREYGREGLLAFTETQTINIAKG